MPSFRIKDRDKGRRLKQFFRGLKNLGDLRLQAGIPPEAGAVTRNNGSITLAEIAEIHEFGAPEANIPQRSFLRETFDKNQRKYGRALDRSTERVVKRRSTNRAELEKIGRVVVDDIVERIDRKDFVPNAPKTVAKKGFDHPLVETGELRDAIDWKVRKK